ncbi:hypothetical protein HHI36_018787 [Cryptolaemus montrouzieri]|uniref:Uncharacterized protein n=1 Tax=Cryptolaemus montrouzieri TaxID=559131 RepID=A0ABD2P1M6_9CUCU
MKKTLQRSVKPRIDPKVLKDPIIADIISQELSSKTDQIEISEGKRARGRRRTSWMSNLRNWTGLNREELIHTARDRWRYAMLLPTSESEKAPRERVRSIAQYTN